jgi:alpha-L-rhamnosidase
MNSFNHYSLGSCGQWLFDSAAGIGLDPEGPGFRHIIIHPRPWVHGARGGGLTSASARLRSIRGLIASSWAVKDGVFTLDLTIPANTTATVCVPAVDHGYMVPAAAVQESGKPAAESEGVKFLRAENGEAVFEVQSGVYRFTVR